MRPPLMSKHKEKPATKQAIYSLSMFEKKGGDWDR